MSIALEREVRELRKAVIELQKQMEELKVPRESTGLSTDFKGLIERYAQKFGKQPHHLMKPETIAERLK